jgi:hypothetical protein
MLHFETIDTGTLELLKKLQSLPFLKDTRLVGGTGLALQLGHRKSVDLDFFGVISSDEYEVSKQLSATGKTRLLQRTENIGIWTIDGIKVDIVNYHYEWLDAVVIDKGIVLADVKDIAAMKLGAITGRGTKKDFIDLYFLLQRYSLRDLLDFYRMKYPEGTEFLVLKSLAWYDDAENDEEPLMLQSVSWETVKSTIRKALEKEALR